jgi:peptidoglycan hydrolase FlgJ
MNALELSRININNSATSLQSSKIGLKEVTQEFEALLIKQMLNAMKKTITKSGLNDGGMAENIFEDFLYDEYSKIMAKTGDFGIANILYKQLNG